MNPRLAFIGTGIMGAPMAGHLLAAGHPLSLHSRTKSKAEALLRRGAKWADSPAAAARYADVVLVHIPPTPGPEPRRLRGAGTGPQGRPQPAENRRRPLRRRRRFVATVQPRPAHARRRLQGGVHDRPSG